MIREHNLVILNGLGVGSYSIEMMNNVSEIKRVLIALYSNNIVHLRDN